MTAVNPAEVIKTAANAPFLAFLYRIKRNMLLRIWALQSILQNQNPFLKCFSSHRKLCWSRLFIQPLRSFYGWRLRNSLLHQNLILHCWTEGNEFLIFKIGIFDEFFLCSIFNVIFLDSSKCFFTFMHCLSYSIRYDYICILLSGTILIQNKKVVNSIIFTYYIK